MFKALLLALLLSVSLSEKMSSQISAFICENPVGRFYLFEDFFQKKYASTQDKQDAIQNFVNNCRDFRQAATIMNKQSQNAINARFDLDFDLIRNNRIIFPGNGKTQEDIKDVSSNQENFIVGAAKKLVGSSCPPNHKSLASPVKNQGSCGSCWTFSTAAAYESAWNRMNDQVLDLSQEYILQCTNAYDPSKSPPSSCSGGILDYALQMIVNSGLPTEQTYPYAASTFGSVTGFPSTVGSCSNTANFHKIVFPSNNSNAQWFRYDNISNSAIQTLLQRGSLVVAYYVDPTFYSHSSGIFSCPVNSTEAYANINHAVELVGMDCNGNYIIKNSWGTSWGDGGYATIDQANDCGLSAFVYSILGENYLRITIFLSIFMMMILLS